jgi:hypothetical protein
MSILCSISTRGRYFTTLPLAINAVIQQTQKVDKLIIYDDNDDPQDLRENNLYSNLFHMLNIKNIAWEWLFTERKGQHHNHQRANTSGYDWVWRVDDDNIPEPTVLSTLCSYIKEDVGAVGGAVFCPTWTISEQNNSTGLLKDIDSETNIQWNSIKQVKQVEHLHCSFLYRAGICDYNLSLSRVAHREETLFSWGLHQAGYKLLVVPDAVTWHLKSPGGIRQDDTYELYAHDDQIFRNITGFADATIVVLNAGMGDHVVFKHVLPEIKNPILFTCYPDIVPGRSIAEAEMLFGDIECYNIYRKMDQWKWTDSLESAYRKLYVK